MGSVSNDQLQAILDVYRKTLREEGVKIIKDARLYAQKEYAEIINSAKRKAAEEAEAILQKARVAAQNELQLMLEKSREAAADHLNTLLKKAQETAAAKTTPDEFLPDSLLWNFQSWYLEKLRPVVRNVSQGTLLWSTTIIMWLSLIFSTKFFYDKAGKNNSASFSIIIGQFLIAAPRVYNNRRMPDKLGRLANLLVVGLIGIVYAIVCQTDAIDILPKEIRDIAHGGFIGLTIEYSTYGYLSVVEIIPAMLIFIRFFRGTDWVVCRKYAGGVTIFGVLGAFFNAIYFEVQENPIPGVL